MKIKLFFKKVKLWFIERWKEFQSIQRDKKEIKTMHQVNKVEFSKKHPTYTIVTRVIAVVILCIFSLFMLFSCFRGYDKLKNQKTLTASAENFIPPQHYYLNIDLPAVPISMNFDISGEDDWYPVQYFYPFGIFVDTQDCSIIGYYSYDPSDAYTIWTERTNVEELDCFLLCDDTTFNIDGVYDDYPLYTLLNVTSSSGNITEFVYFEVLPHNGLYGTYQGVLYNSCFLVRLNDDDGEYREYIYGVPADDINANFSYMGSYNYYYSSEPLYNDAYLIGESFGYNSGYDEGYRFGYYDGYNDGELDGYNFGYELGLSESLEDVTPWQVIVDGVNRFFGLSFLGNGVTIGLILSIGFGMILLGFAIKIFLGG